METITHTAICRLYVRLRQTETGDKIHIGTIELLFNRSTENREQD